ncbi:MAG: 30S ribosomal protein S16 [Candidatus Moraniibacteriota bacterium]
MLTIRLARTGKRNTAQFKIMLQERTIAPGGRHVEILGSYNPHSKAVVLEADRIKYWIEKGAFLSDTMHNLLVKNGVISEKKRIVKLPKKAVVAEAEAPKEDAAAPKAEEVPAEVVAPKADEVVAEKKEEIAVSKTEEVVATEKTPEAKS